MEAILVVTEFSRFSNTSTRRTIRTVRAFNPREKESIFKRVRDSLIKQDEIPFLIEQPGRVDLVEGLVEFFKVRYC